MWDCGSLFPVIRNKAYSVGRQSRPESLGVQVGVDRDQFLESLRQIAGASGADDSALGRSKLSLEPYRVRLARARHPRSSGSHG